MKIRYENGFWYDENDEKSRVFQYFPDVYGDNRGDFSEVLKDTGEWSENREYPLWFSNMSWIRQINRSKSSSGVIRGCHAQRGRFCQGKLVEAMNRRIYDIITDARPDSDTFGTSSIYLLDPDIQNKLWIPRGFLHAFVVPFEDTTEKAIFNYYVDNSYSKGSEICVNPKSLIPKIVNTRPTDIKGTELNISDFSMLFEMFEGYDSKKLTYSEKDVNGEEYCNFMETVRGEYSDTGKTWYK